MLTLLWVALAMGAQDMLGTFMTVAEVRGRENLAGACDSLGDAAKFIGTVYGAGTAIQDGWTPRAFEVLAVMMVVSFFGTRFWTRISRRIREKAETAVEAA